MGKSTKWLALMLGIILGAVLLTGGCGSSPPTSSDKQDKKVVKIGYVNWAEGVAMTHLAKVILEDKMGYAVEVTMADVAPVFTSVANGDYDIFMDTWLPATHESYLKEYGDKLVDLGISFKGAKIGLVVPEHVDINSIEELNSVKAKFEGKIIGIDSGAGIMKATDKAIKDYNLDYTLLASSETAMTASLKDAVEKKEWVVVTGWKPHWKFASWKLKFLDDPKKVFGEVENIHIVSRKNFEKDMPEAAQFFKNFKLTDEQLGSLMGLARQSDDPVKSAKEWLKSNEQLVNGWLPKK